MRRLLIALLWFLGLTAAGQAVQPTWSSHERSYSPRPKTTRPADPGRNELPQFRYYSSWADLAEQTSRDTLPAQLTLALDAESGRGDWVSLKRVRRVRRLTLTVSHSLTQAVADSLLTALAHWPTLSSIVVSGTDNEATDSRPPTALDGATSARLTSVRQLTVYAWSRNSLEMLSLLRHCPDIQRLTLAGFQSPQAEAIRQVIQDFSRVHSLDLHLYGTGDQPDLARLIGHRPGLTALSLLGSGQSGASVVAMLRQLPNLRSLSLRFERQPVAQSREAGSLQLGCLPKLDSLLLQYADKTPTRADSLLGGVRTLTSVTLYNLALSSLDWMADNPALRTVTISGGGLPPLTRSLAHLTQLRQLSINGMDTTGAFPERLTTIPRLEQLMIQNNPLVTLPPSIGNLTSLTALTLNNCRLRQLPAELVGLINLKRLDLGSNQLTELPAAITRLANLRQLRLVNNQLTTLPANLWQLRYLTSLDLAQNTLTRLPDDMKQARHLRELTLTMNPLASLPESLGQADSLETLQLDRTHLTALPAGIGRLGQLRQLRISGSTLRSLPESLTNCVQLTTVAIRDSTLTALPGQLGNLTRLTSLELDLPYLTLLPGSLVQLSQLSYLGLKTPELLTLPDDLGKLSQLRSLNVSSRRLAALPGSLGRLANLMHIAVDGLQDDRTGPPTGRLQQLPDSLFHCPKLMTIDIRNQVRFDGAAAIQQSVNAPVLVRLALNRCGVDQLAGIDWKTIRLRQLALSHNDLRDVPEAILEAPRLETVDLLGNAALSPALNRSFWNKADLQVAFAEGHLLNAPVTDKPDAVAMKAYRNAAMRQLQQRNWGEAIAELDNAVRVAPDSLKADVLVQRASVYFGRKEYALAVADYEAAIARAAARRPVLPVGYASQLKARYAWSWQLGMARNKLAQYDRALVDLDTALAGFGQGRAGAMLVAPAQLERAKAFVGLRRYQETQEALTNGLDAYAAMPYAGPGELLTMAELGILTNQPAKATAALNRFQTQYATAGNQPNGYGGLYVYLKSGVDLLTGRQTAAQAQETLTQSLKTNTRKIYNWSFVLFETILPHIGLPAEKRDGLAALTALVKAQAVLAD